MNRLEPTLTAHLFPSLGENLVELLRGLQREEWGRPTVCSAWAVRDIAAHLLDTACRRVGVERDAHVLPPPTKPIEGYESLVAYLNELNSDWVRASQRLSPRLIVDLLERVEGDLADTLASLDPMATARFPVAWAGEAGSRVWFDVARELTERWLHQQQIRLAVGAPALDEPAISEAIFDTFLRSLPSRYEEIGAVAGEAIGIEIVGRTEYSYGLRSDGDSWTLLKGSADEGLIASVRLSEEDAWLSLTKGIAPEEARRRAEVDGREECVSAFFETVAVMA